MSMDNGAPIEYDERLQAWKLWLHGGVGGVDGNLGGVGGLRTGWGLGEFPSQFCLRIITEDGNVH